MKILVLDDSLTIRMDLAEIFGRAGFATTPCADFASARRAIADAPHDLVVLGAALPDADASDVLAFLRRDGATAALPVILLAGEPARGESDGAPRADAYMPKPYDAAALVARARALTERPEGAPPPRCLVLVIEDSLTYREALRAALEAAGYAVAVAASGEEGLERALALRPHAVIVDGGLPGINGVTVLRRIRHDAGLRRTPCLLLTASDGAEAELAALEAGADAFVRKQHDLGLALARLAALLRAAGEPSETDRQHAVSAMRVMVVGGGELVTLAGGLAAEGYAVLRAASGEDALEALGGSSVDALIVSLTLTGLSGLDTCRRLKAHPAWRHVPLLLVAGEDAEAGVIEGLNAGADDVLAAGEALEVVRGRLRAQLRRKAFEDESRQAREESLRRQFEASEALAAQELAAIRAALLADLERKNAQLEEAKARAEAAARAKAEFLAHMSHEIRTPLSALLGSADLLSRTALSAEQQRYVSLFQRGGENLLWVVNDVLDMSKLDAGSLSLESAPFDLLALIERTLEIGALRAHEKGVELTWSAPTAEAWPVVGDAHRLAQVLQNLTTNAIKFTEAGEVALSVAPWPDGPDGMVVFRVADTGVGLPAELLESVFEAFVQAEPSTTRHYGGTGLGLTICRRLVAMMGGRIWAEQRPGGGSLFSFTAMLPGRPASTAQRPLEGRRILVADDNDTARRNLAAWLTAWGAIVQEADDGEAAWEQLSAGAFDGVLLDGRMPDVDGLEVLERLGDRPARPPVVVLTTVDALADTGERATALGAHGCLPKPVRRDELLAALSRRGVEAGPAAGEAPGQPVGLRILLAEDTPDNRVIFRAFLERTPHRMDMVENGLEALHRFQRQDYDLVLMDMQMPVMDGYAATRAIRAWELEAGRSPTPILALTAFALAEEVAKTREAGCDGHLTKPILRRGFLETLDAWAKRAEPARPTVAIDAALEALLPEFLANRHIDLTELASALADGAWEAVGAVAHRFIGMGSTYGFDAISEAGRAIGTAARARDAGAVRRVADDLAGYLERVEVVFVDDAP